MCREKIVPLHWVEQRGIDGREAGLEREGRKQAADGKSRRTVVVLAIRCTAPKL